MAGDELLSVEDILAVDDRGASTVDVPEWGGKVKVRGISGRLRWRFEAAVLKGRQTGDYADMADVQVAIVAEALGVGSKEYAKLANKNAGALDRIRDAALKVSGMDDEDVESFGEAHSDVSTSD